MERTEQGAVENDDRHDGGDINRSGVGTTAVVEETTAVKEVVRHDYPPENTRGWRIKRRRWASGLGASELVVVVGEDEDGVGGVAWARAEVLTGRA